MVLNIGIWNMTSTASKTLATGLAATKILSATAIIVYDDGVTIAGKLEPLLFTAAPFYGAGGTVHILGADITLDRYTSTDIANIGLDNTKVLPAYAAGFSSTANNRGYIIIHYLP